MFIINKINLKTIIEALTAIAIPLVYFFLIGGFNGGPQNEQNNKPYDPLSLIKTDFVKDIQAGKYDFSGFDTSKQKMNFKNCNLKYFLSSQRVVINAGENRDRTPGEYYFNTVNGYKEKDSIGVNALYFSSGNFVDGRKKMEACYVAEDLNGVSIKYDSIVSNEWFFKPKMKIRKSDFSPADTRTVAAIIIYNFAGKMIDSTVIKVRNFSDMSGKYEGDFIDKYNTADEIPVNNMRISSVDLFKNMPKNNTGLNIKLFWFGEVDLWFEKITIDDNMADKLLSGAYNEQIVQDITYNDILNSVIMIKNNYFSKLTFTSVNYIMNVMYSKLQDQSLPFILQSP